MTDSDHLGVAEYTHEITQRHVQAEASTMGRYDPSMLFLILCLLRTRQIVIAKFADGGIPGVQSFADVTSKSVLGDTVFRRPRLNPGTSGSLIRSDRMAGIRGWFEACGGSCCGKPFDRPFCAQSGRLHALAKPCPRLRWLPIPYRRTSAHIVGTGRGSGCGRCENHDHTHMSPVAP